MFPDQTPLLVTYYESYTPLLVELQSASIDRLGVCIKIIQLMEVIQKSGMICLDYSLQNIAVVTDCYKLISMAPIIPFIPLSYNIYHNVLAHTNNKRICSLKII